MFATAKWGFWHEHAHLISDTYVAAIWESGGYPLIVPPLGGGDPAVLSAVLDHVDGLLFVGGADINPCEYGEQPHELLEETSQVRDTFELPLIRLALARDVPILGVCRGMQAMNVAVGGTLHQDLGELGVSVHRPLPGHLDEATFHEVRVAPGTLLASVMQGPEILANSHHHQGVAKVAEGAIICGLASSDGGVEAIEWPDKCFALGVQWHPERPRSEPLFSALVAAATFRRVTS